MDSIIYIFFYWICIYINFTWIVNIHYLHILSFCIVNFTSSCQIFYFYNIVVDQSLLCSEIWLILCCENIDKMFTVPSFYYYCYYMCVGGIVWPLEFEFASDIILVLKIWNFKPSKLVIQKQYYYNFCLWMNYIDIFTNFWRLKKGIFKFQKLK